MTKKNLLIHRYVLRTRPEFAIQALWWNGDGEWGGLEEACLLTLSEARNLLLDCVDKDSHKIFAMIEKVTLKEAEFIVSNICNIK